jgi:short-subunit dehydrogenase
MSTSSAAPHCCIIGAGPGIGAAVAEAFAEEGLNLSLIARSPEHLRELVAELIKQTGRRVQTFAGDAGNDQSLLAALRAAVRALGPVDVLIYNVASFETGRPTTLSTERLLSEFHTNVAGALTAAREVAGPMRKRKHGTLLFTGGGFAYEPAPNYASLSLGKAALRSLTYTLAQELGVDGIHVATVTVHGFVQPGTKFDPRNIAASYIALYRQPQGHFEIEKIFK